MPEETVRTVGGAKWAVGGAEWTVGGSKKSIRVKTNRNLSKR